MVRKMLDEAENNISSVYVTGVLSLIVGMLVVVSHNVWEGSWRVLITLIGWISIIKGLIRLFSPHTVVSVGRRVMHGSLYTMLMVIFLIIGLVLTYNGFWA